MVTNEQRKIEVPKEITIRNNETLKDVIKRLFFVKGKKRHQIIVLHRDSIVCPLCKSNSNPCGYNVPGSRTYKCTNKECKHRFHPNETLPDAEHPIYEMIEGVECLYKNKRSLRKASDYLKTKGIRISYYGVRGWKRVVPDLIRVLVNSLKPESNNESVRDNIKSIKKNMSWLRPWKRYEYAKVSTYTPMRLLKDGGIKPNVIESHEKDNKIILKTNKPCTMEIDKNDKLTQRIMMAALNNTNPTLLKEIADIFGVSEYIVTANTKKYLEGGSDNLDDKRGGSESKLTPMIMEKTVYHLLNSYFESGKINNEIIAERVSAELKSENLKISREIVRQFRNAINFNKTVEKLNLIKKVLTESLKKTKTKG